MPKLIVIFLLSICASVVLLKTASSQEPSGQAASSSPAPSPTPSPSPSPTPVTGLHQWGAVTLFHGLPSDRVHAIAQGRDGAMWFGTEAGLARFDGRRTQTMIIPDLPGKILALESDQAGGLWIGTDAGAARLIDGHFELISEIAGNSITSIVAPEAGRVLLTTERGNIFECHLEADGSRHTKPLLNQPLESADREHPGPLALTSVALLNNQVMVGSLSRGLLTIIDGMARERETGPAAFFVRALAVDEGAKLWVGTRVRKDEPGLLTGRGAADLVRNETPTGTVTTIQNIGHDVWVATDGNGVFIFSDSKKAQRFTFDGTSGGLRSDHVYAIFQDREEVVWFGTDRGVCRYDPNAARLEAVGNSSESNFIRTFYQTSAGQLLTGTNRGLFVYEASSSAWNLVPGLGGNIIYSLDEDNSGSLLVGSAAGFFVGPAMSRETKIESLTFSRTEASSGNADAIGSIRAITSFRGLTYISSFGRGVEKFEAGRLTNLWSVNSTIPRDVISLFAEGERRLLIGSASDGVFTYDGVEVKPDPAFAKLKGSTVRSIQSTPDKTLWFATNRGVYACKANSECLLAAPGFEARFLAPDPNGKQNEMWCATSGAGLLKIRIDDQVGAVVSELDAEQGLPSQNVFAVQPLSKPDGNESLLIGTSRGIARYRPDRVAPTLYATRVVSKRVHSAGELQSGLYLEYPQNSLLIDVAAINSRTFPEQFQYAFTLIDANNAVIKKLSRESQFTMEGLRPGKYRVTARAFSKDLVASEPLSFELSIAKAPFPWTSTALAILLALALLALIWAIMERRRIARTSAALVAANNELADARLNLANEAERERRRIARDLHDQTLADLRHLLMLSDQAPANGADGKQLDPALLRTEIEAISQEVRRICEDLSPSVLQNVGFAAALEFALSHAVQDAPADRRFDYEFVCDESLEERAQLPPNVQMQIYRMVQEAVSNIWRHAGATHVKMTVDANPGGDFVLQLQDNGRDFDPSEQKNLEGRGLANMRARASLIGAEIFWLRQESGGTVFTLRKSRNLD